MIVERADASLRIWRDATTYIQALRNSPDEFAVRFVDSICEDSRVTSWLAPVGTTEITSDGRRVVRLAITFDWQRAIFDDAFESVLFHNPEARSLLGQCLERARASVKVEEERLNSAPVTVSTDPITGQNVVTGGTEVSPEDIGKPAVSVVPTLPFAQKPFIPRAPEPPPPSLVVGDPVEVGTGAIAAVQAVAKPPAPPAPKRVDERIFIIAGIGLSILAAIIIGGKRGS